MKVAELVFIPAPGVGHLVPAVELANLMIHRDEQLSFTILVIKLPSFDAKITSYITSIAASLTTDRIRIINLPTNTEQTHNPTNFLASFIESQNPHVREAVSELVATRSGLSSWKLAGFIVGMFCTPMIDVANEFGVDSYVFFPSSAASLGFVLHMQALNDDQNVDTTEFKDSDTELLIPSFQNPVPAKVFPSVVFNKNWHSLYYGNAGRYKETKGILVNTFMELESHAISSMSFPVYPVGPLLNLKGDNDGRDDSSSSSGAHKKDEIMAWLDDQPPLSVVFLCFGSMGSLSEAQVKEIACAVDHSGLRFLWSIRQPPPKGKMGLPTDYTNPAAVLPEGFLDRTAEIGRVIGWAPQVAILSHRSIGGFVSHCGWNSIQESLWYGVPIATWPLYSEQQLNAFELIVELGLAAEIKMDYRKDVFGTADQEVIVSRDDIERGIRCVMEQDSDVRKRVKIISQKCKVALMDGGSSFSSIGRLIANIIENI
ncbi:anthocyanidin 3-O-glucosyltransferase 2-like [Mercurialis annua]|uniref:anthocyanidin 3-O-glucosyltransferase 2-like n=1 Tax=Mercurialis annua TaxID=3986 RepID=UPI00215F131B|nr:anthocyanidin 3-O-glucosyltransferase 2-like [Mercurialis annua]